MSKIYPVHTDISCQSCLELSLCRSVLWYRRGHVIPLPRTHLQLSRLTFFILRLNTNLEAVHTAVVDLVLSQRKAKAVACGQVADDLRQSRTVVFHASYLHRLATRLLCEVFGAAVK